MNSKKYIVSKRATRNYVNVWLTDTLRSRIYGKLRGSDAKPVRIEWDTDKNIVRADIINVSDRTSESTLFNLPVESISKAYFEGNRFNLKIQGKRYRFVIANDEFEKEYDTSGHNTATYFIALAEDILSDPAVSDLQRLRRILETHNVKVIRPRILRSIFLGFAVTFIMLAILYLIGFIYAKSQGEL